MGSDNHSFNPSTIAPGATGTITAPFKDTGAAASNLVTDIEVYTSAGTKVSQQVFPGQNFTVGGTNTNNWSWTAPTTTSTYTVSLGVFNSAWSTLYYWGGNAATITVATLNTAQYNFESSTQSWASSGGMISGISSSTTQALTGTHSLAVPINSTGSGSTQQVYVSGPVHCGRQGCHVPRLDPVGQRDLSDPGLCAGSQLGQQLAADRQPQNQRLEHADGHRSEQRRHPAERARRPVRHQNISRFIANTDAFAADLSPII